MTPAAGGTRIIYTADISFLGLIGYAEPYMGRMLAGVGKNAIRGLQAALSADPPPPSQNLWTNLQDRLILPGMLGFTNLGYCWHHRSWKPQALSLRGKTAIVTGATSGLGQAAARLPV